MRSTEPEQIGFGGMLRGFPEIRGPFRESV